MRNRWRVLAFDILAPAAAVVALVFIGVALGWPLWWVSVCSVLCLLIVEGVVVNFALARRDSVTVGTDDDGPGLRLAVVAVATAALVTGVVVGYMRWTVPDRALGNASAEVVGIASSISEASATFAPQSPTASVDRATSMMSPKTAEQVEDVVVATLESPPANATHWSRTSMAERAGLSKSTIGRIWKAFELQPHRSEDFKLSNDPLFVEKVYDIVGLYLDPPEAAVVLCVDEKSQIQALARSQPAFPMMPGMPEKRTHDYVRHGTTSLFAAFDTSDGTVITALHRRHRAIEFRKFLATIDAQVPDHLDIHLVCDNYGTHKAPAVQSWLARHPRFHMHYTPTYSSWINQVERWFAELTRQLIQRGDHRSVQALERDIRAWAAAWNDNPKPFVWTKTAEQILQSIQRLMKRINGAGH